MFKWLISKFKKKEEVEFKQEDYLSNFDKKELERSKKQRASNSSRNSGGSGTYTDYRSDYRTSTPSRSYTYFDSTPSYTSYDSCSSSSYDSGSSSCDSSSSSCCD